MKIREKLPTKLTKNNFLVRIPDISEDEDELVTSTEEDNILKVELKSNDCTLNIGDEVIMSAKTLPIVVIKTELGDYAMFREYDVEGIW